MLVASQEIVERILLLLFSFLDQEFYYEVTTFFSRENKKLNWKDTSLLLMNWKLYISWK